MLQFNGTDQNTLHTKHPLPHPCFSSAAACGARHICRPTAMLRDVLYPRSSLCDVPLADEALDDCPVIQLHRADCQRRRHLADERPHVFQRQVEHLQCHRGTTSCRPDHARLGWPHRRGRRQRIQPVAGRAVAGFHEGGVKLRQLPVQRVASQVEPANRQPQPRCRLLRRRCCCCCGHASTAQRQFRCQLRRVLADSLALESAAPTGTQICSASSATVPEGHCQNATVAANSRDSPDSGIILTMPGLTSASYAPLQLVVADLMPSDAVSSSSWLAGCTRRLKHIL